MSSEAPARKTAAQSDTMRRSQVADGIYGAQEQTARQLEQIAHMTNENEQLKKEISSVSGTHYDYVKADKLASLQGDVDALERRYQFEKMRKNDLTKRYQLIRIDLLHSRKMKGGVNVEKEQADAVQRQVEILESRLDQALGQFNDALSYNKELRDRIDVIREERRVFQRVHKRMEDDLKSKKRLMAEHIEKSNRDMDDRDAHVREVARLRAALDEQRQVYAEQLRDLDTAMLDIKAMREEQTEMQLELEAREYEFGERANDASAARAHEDARGGTTSGTADDNVSVAGSEAPDEAANVLRVEKESATITSILHQIKEAFLTDNLEELRAQYVHTGDLNFSLYKYINELSAKKDVLKDNIRDLQRLLSEEDDSEAQHRALIRRLEEELADTEGRLDEMTAATSQLRDGVRRTCGTAEEVYAHIGCQQMGDGAVDGEERCTEANMKQFFGIIEERATQILIAFQRHHQAPAYSRRVAASSRAAREVELPKDSSRATEEEEENALTANTADSTPAEAAAAVADEWDGEDDIAPMMPTAPQTAHCAVSARNLVRMVDLPSASLGAGATDRDNALYVEQDDDHIVSHEDIRRQMETRLAAMREREDRNQQRKKKEMGRETPQKAAAQQGKAGLAVTAK